MHACRLLYVYCYCIIIAILMCVLYCWGIITHMYIIIRNNNIIIPMYVHKVSHDSSGMHCSHQYTWCSGPTHIECSHIRFFGSRSLSSAVADFGNAVVSTALIVTRPAFILTFQQWDLGQLWGAVAAHVVGVRCQLCITLVLIVLTDTIRGITCRCPWGGESPTHGWVVTNIVIIVALK